MNVKPFRDNPIIFTFGESTAFLLCFKASRNWETQIPVHYANPVQGNIGGRST